MKLLMLPLLIWSLQMGMDTNLLTSTATVIPPELLRPLVVQQIVKTNRLLENGTVNRFGEPITSSAPLLAEALPTPRPPHSGEDRDEDVEDDEDDLLQDEAEMVNLDDIGEGNETNTNFSHYLTTRPDEEADSLANGVEDVAIDTGEQVNLTDSMVTDSPLTPCNRTYHVSNCTLFTNDSIKIDVNVALQNDTKNTTGRLGSEKPVSSFLPNASQSFGPALDEARKSESQPGLPNDFSWISIGIPRAWITNTSTDIDNDISLLMPSFDPRLVDDKTAQKPIVQGTPEILPAAVEVLRRMVASGEKDLSSNLKEFSISSDGGMGSASSTNEVALHKNPSNNYGVYLQMMSLITCLERRNCTFNQLTEIIQLLYSSLENNSSPISPSEADSSEELNHLTESSSMEESDVNSNKEAAFKLSHKKSSSHGHRRDFIISKTGHGSNVMGISEIMSKKPLEATGIPQLSDYVLSRNRAYAGGVGPTVSKPQKSVRTKSRKRGKKKSSKKAAEARGDAVKKESNIFMKFVKY